MTAVEIFFEDLVHLGYIEYPDESLVQDRLKLALELEKQQLCDLVKKLNIAKEALNNIAGWNDDLENQYGDPGECAIEALIKIRNL
jgi:hypothetical protein